MKGAIIGDIVGSIYEFHNIKTKDFPLFQDHCMFTDDTVMTCAVAYGLYTHDAHDPDISEYLAHRMQDFGRRYPHRGYGGRFKVWLWLPNPQPYNSLGNGAAMRASPAGFFGFTPEDARLVGMSTALPTHNHPEGLKAAGLIAELIWLARNNVPKEELRKRALQVYELPTLDDIRPVYSFDVTCQGTMPVALSAFFESTSFEDAIRNAISVGGDSDTIAAITGSLAEAFYGAPEDVWKRACDFLDSDLIKVVERFYTFCGASHPVAHRISSLLTYQEKSLL